MTALEEFEGDLSILHRSLRSNGSGSLARGRLRKLRRAVDVFGFHLASLDLRQNSDVHRARDRRAASRRPSPARTTRGCRRTSASPCCWKSSGRRAS